MYYDESMTDESMTKEEASKFACDVSKISGYPTMYVIQRGSDFGACSDLEFIAKDEVVIETYVAGEPV